MLANPCIGAPRHRLLTGHPSQHSSGTRVPPRCSKRHRGQWVVSGELTRFSQASQYRPASPTDRLLKRMETGRGGCCNPSPASVSDQVHQTSYPYEEAFKQDTGGIGANLLVDMTDLVGYDFGGTVCTPAETSEPNK